MPIADEATPPHPQPIAAGDEQDRCEGNRSTSEIAGHLQLGCRPVNW